MQPTINFTKMHGLGNDFVVINTLNQTVDVGALNIVDLADRYMGIGFDQLLVIESSKSADFFCRIFNADGSEAEQCGNGLRCVARFLHESGIYNKSTLHIETKAGIFPIQIKDYDHICITMGLPQIQESLVELKLDTLSDTIPISILSLGNPHAIMRVATVDTEMATTLSEVITAHSHFPHGANVGLMEIVNAHHIRLRTFERGVGETNACGSNACAAVVAGIANGWLQHKVNVEFRHGKLNIEWRGGDQPIYMTGPASRVFVGEIYN